MTDFTSLTTEDISRFWAHVERSENCWTWTAATTRGYGHMVLRKDKRQIKFYAHRVSYWLSKGAIPDGLVVDHMCHNKSCVNPKHLRLATVKQNNENLIGAQQRNPSALRGVTRCGAKWRARVVSGGKEYHLGTFASKDEASKVAIAARLEMQSHNDLDRMNGSLQFSTR